MEENQDQIALLLEKIERLMQKQDAFQREIAELHLEVEHLKISSFITTEAYGLPPEAIEDAPVEAEAPGANEPVPSPAFQFNGESERNPVASVPREKPKAKSDLEKFIGENLINKIGIACTIIGVGIGAKYAIDHDLISPLTRIILGYLVGLGLFGFAFRLKKQYESFSAVLLSGSMAIMYFITFAAYSFYDLIPVIPAFMLMVLFTAFTVAAAITYNRQVIAHIGLVGAYAVPFLLSDGSGRVLILYSYMALINIGILVISFRKYWKPLNYSSFLLTWIIFVSWCATKYDAGEHFTLSLAFAAAFFAMFYTIFLAYKLIRKEDFKLEDILFLLANSAVFYGLGYATLHSDIAGERFTGLFTLGNAVIHFAVAAIIWFQKPADRGLLSYAIGLGLVFVTIAIPVQLDGNWVTLLWCGEAAALFWIGRTKNIAVYELLSYPLIFLCFFSLLDDWDMGYNTYDPLVPGTRIIPLVNIHFLTSMLVVASLGFIQYTGSLKKYCSPLEAKKTLMQFLRFVIPALLLVILYCSFLKEITTFWNQLYQDSAVVKNQDLTVPQHFHDENLLKYRAVALFNYSLLFFSLLSLINIHRIKNTALGLVNLGLDTIVLGLFLTLGLYTIGELRESFISRELSEFYYRGAGTVGIRYMSFMFVGLMLYAIHRYIRQDFLKINFRIEYDFLLHITLLTLISNELINWMDLYEPGQSYKLGLSILFGLYALVLVALGIWKKKAHLRIAAIALFGATLLKLFFYDLADLSTISKTIVFVILGVLLLIISFLYNKYRSLIFDEREEERDA